MSKKLEVLYREYEKTKKGYSDGGEVSATDQLQKNINSDFKFGNKPPHVLSRDERNELIRQQNTSNALGKTSPIGQHIFKPGDTSDDYNQGGKVSHNKKNLEELKKAFAKFINEEGSENYSQGGAVKGYSDGTEEPIQPEVDLSDLTPDQKQRLLENNTPPAPPEQFQKHLQDLQAQGVNLDDVNGNTQNINGQLPPKPSLDSNAQPASLETAPNPDDKQLEDQVQNEDFVANEKAEPKRSTASEDDSDDSDDKDETDTADKEIEKDEDNEDRKPASDQDKTPDVQSQNQTPDQNQDQSSYTKLLQSLNAGRSNGLANAQKERDQRQNFQDIAKYATILGSGFARTNPKPYLDLIPDRSNQPIEDYNAKIANQKNDPNSPVSKVVAQYLTSKGFNLPPGTSANDAMTIMPFLKNDQMLDNQIKKTVMQVTGRKDVATGHDIAAGKRADAANAIRKQANVIAQQRADAATKNAANSLDTKTNTALKQYAEKTNPNNASSRKVLGTAGNTVQSVESAFALIRGTKDLNDINPQQNEELVRVLDRVLSKASPTEFGSKSLNAHTAEEKWANIKQFITNMPAGAQKAAFLENIKASLAREALTAEKQIDNNIKIEGAAFAPYRTKAPDLFNNYDTVLKNSVFTPDLQQELQPYRAKYSASGQSNSQHKPGDIVQYKGKPYKVGADGDSLEEVK